MGSQECNRILIAAQHASTRTVLLYSLKHEFVEVVTESTGHRALRWCLDESFVALIIEHSLSDCNAVQIMMALQAAGRSLPILILGDSRILETTHIARYRGNVHCLSGFPTPKALRTAVRRLCSA